MTAALIALVVGATQVRPAKVRHETRLVGRVLADVEWLVPGAGLGPQWETFIFVVETGNPRLSPVRISYAYFKPDRPLPDAFFDYAERYSLLVVRDKGCDESVASLTWEKNVDIQLLKGAPRDLLQPKDILPCYILRPGNYQKLGQATEPE